MYLILLGAVFVIQLAEFLWNSKCNDSITFYYLRSLLSFICFNRNEVNYYNFESKRTAS